ncbi:uncharacterized protein LOC112590182 [Harpegnathos saltator]|uniref:uncharacterized protein LOC112590182 n=1 Tax=Harpegnathos saltator TaxID=610380 RepID=UPI000DBEE39E|nr:uncharacterized protein LOC112590182 [Harpegnathos saltator]
MLPIRLVTQDPFEYMHLVCLGVMKKLLVNAWVHGKYSKFSKLSAKSISIISARMKILRAYCPSDFAQLRSLDACTKYKATEFRQFFLYTGPIVTYDILNQQVYTYFLLLHAAIRILVSTSSSKIYLNFVEVALQKFVERCENMYGSTFNSCNIHGLLHIANDVRQLANFK